MFKFSVLIKGLSLIALAAIVFSCGQKGPLVLPQDPAVEPVQTSTVENEAPVVSD